MKNIYQPVRFFLNYQKSKRYPYRVQKKILRYILNEQKNTAYGKAHSFSSISSVKEFQKKVPITNYEDIKPYIQKIKQGEQNILTKKKVIFFATSSGTTSASKYIPVTSDRMKIFTNEFQLWSTRVLKKEQIKVLGGKTLYFATASNLGTTKANIQFGNITGYMVQKLPAMLKRKLVLPAHVYNIKNVKQRTEKIALVSLQEDVRQLGFFAPIETILFLEYIYKNKKKLIAKIKKTNPKRAKELEELPEFKAKYFWPKLSLISCVKTPSTIFYLDQLFELIGKKIPTRDPGIYASEGRISLGIVNNSRNGIIVANTSFFEFCECTKNATFKDPVCIHKIKKGKKYKVLITTTEGLYRHDIGDIVEVRGFKKKLPIIRYADRDNYINVAGENMSEINLVTCVKEELQKQNIKSKHFTVCPCISSPKNKPCYEALLELDMTISDKKLSRFAKELEKNLQEKVLTYKKARNEFGRLEALQASIVKTQSYAKHTTKKQQKQKGQIKPILVSKDPTFREQFDIIKSVTATKK
ncbi:MAG: GH3 auxin-responsive promoter family protein [Candidatus Woesearchaeota archaeon]